MSRLIRTGILLATLVAGGAACSSKSDQAPDNTGRNDRDRGSPKVADKAVDSDRDLELTQEIRQAVVGNDSLSMNAKNVKIVVQSGVVTLRGPVASAEERATVERIANGFVATRGGSVVNELELAP